MWLDDDYDVAVMWQQERNLECPGCSQPKDEVWVFDPERQHEQEAAWESKLRKCVVCSHRDFRMRQHRADDHADTDGIWPTVERTGDGR